jgi:hypothetical protein
MLRAHDWPGNVRELRNAVARMIVFRDAEERPPGAPNGSGSDAILRLPLREARQQVIERFEKTYILAQLKAHGVNVMRAADAGWYLPPVYTDPTYANTSLVVVREKGPSGAFSDVTLDCAGALAGWQPVGCSGVYEFLRFDLVSAGQAQGSCDNGRHAIDSAAPFAVTVWAWVNYSSYAYPAGASVQSINTIVLP